MLPTVGATQSKGQTTEGSPFPWKKHGQNLKKSKNSHTVNKHDIVCVFQTKKGIFTNKPWNLGILCARSVRICSKFSFNCRMLCASDSGYTSDGERL